MKGMVIYANPGGYDNLALIRFSEVPLQNRHQLIWARHFGCRCGTRSHMEAIGHFVFDFHCAATTPAFFSISMTGKKFVLLN